MHIRTLKINTNEAQVMYVISYIHSLNLYINFYARTFGSTLIILRSLLFLNNRPEALSAITYSMREREREREKEREKTYKLEVKNTCTCTSLS